MKRNDLNKLARTPKFIPGIYNYCDRWCERCPFTSRCLSFAMEQLSTEGGRGGEKRDFWKRFEESFKLTAERIRELAKEHGVTLEPSELEEISRQKDRRRRAVKQHSLAQAALSYSRMLDDWFKSGERLLREKEEEVLAQARLGVAGVNEQVASLTDVVEILRWYQYQIYVKLMRGLDRSPDDEDPGGRQADGSVKVALIAIDRSIAAWMRMKDFFPEKTDSILMLLVHLDRLRRATEREFPNARSFVRPGFDT